MKFLTFQITKTIITDLTDVLMMQVDNQVVCLLQFV